MNIQHLVEILQVSIAPCVLISGLGLLLLSLTNRFGRTTDLCRTLNDEAQLADESELSDLRRQIKLIFRRCLMLRTAIAFNLFSITCAGIIIITIFAVYLLDLSVRYYVIEGVFTLSLLCLISSLVFFLIDIRMSLNSLRIEIRKHVK